MNRVIWAVKDAIWFRQTEWGRLYIHNWVFDLFGTVTSGFCTGKSLSEALLFSEFGKNMLCTKIALNVRNNFCTQHVLPRFELEIFMY